MSLNREEEHKAGCGAVISQLEEILHSTVISCKDGLRAKHQNTRWDSGVLAWEGNDGGMVW